MNEQAVNGQTVSVCDHAQRSCFQSCALSFKSHAIILIYCRHLPRVVLLCACLVGVFYFSLPFGDRLKHFQACMLCLPVPEQLQLRYLPPSVPSVLMLMKKNKYRQYFKMFILTWYHRIAIIFSIILSIILEWFDAFIICKCSICASLWVLRNSVLWGRGRKGLRSLVSVLYGGNQSREVLNHDFTHAGYDV